MNLEPKYINSRLAMNAAMIYVMLEGMPESHIEVVSEVKRENRENMVWQDVRNRLLDFEYYEETQEDRDRKRAVWVYPHKKFESTRKTCGNCGKEGHLVEMCWFPKCQFCRKTGHNVNTCWQLKRFKASQEIEAEIRKIRSKMDQGGSLDVQKERRNKIYGLEQEIEDLVRTIPGPIQNKTTNYKICVARWNLEVTKHKCMKEDCNRTYSNINALRFHIQTNEDHYELLNDDEKEKRKQLRCVYCPQLKPSRTFKILKAHIKLMHIDKSCLHGSCDHVAVNKSKLELHRNEVHGVKLSCSMCQKVGCVWAANNKEELQRHRVDEHYRPTYYENLKEERKQKKREKLEKNEPMFKKGNRSSDIYDNMSFRMKYEAEQEFWERERRDAAGRN